MRVFVWLFRAFIFFTLFAFALNNQQAVSVSWFFGVEWHAPLVIVVLAAFASGCVIGVIAMVPSWWSHRRVAKRHAPASVVAAAPAQTGPLPLDFAPSHPPREGL